MRNQQSESIEQYDDDGAAAKLAATILSRFTNAADFAGSVLDIAAGKLAPSVTGSRAERLLTKLYKAAHTLSQTEQSASFALYVLDHERHAKEEKYLTKDRAAYEGAIKKVVEVLRVDGAKSTNDILLTLCSQVKALRPLGVSI